MARKRVEEEQKEFTNIFDALIDNTGFQISKEAKVLTERAKVRTPLEGVNCLLGGGIPFGVVCHSYGKAKGGKSTLAYQTMVEFTKQYPEGICIIVDMESSADGNRLQFFGLDTSKVLRLPASSIESGFLSVFKLLDNKMKKPELQKVPLFIIWDTISKGMAQDNSTNSRMNAMDRARIIKNYISDLTSRLEKQDSILWLLNQVVTRVDAYGNAKEDFGAGESLKHDVQLNFHITDAKADVVDKGFLIKRKSTVDIVKSKVSPEVGNYSMVFDMSQGGRIDEVESFLDYLFKLGFIDASGGWYKLNSAVDALDKYDKEIGDVLESYNKSYRWSELLQTFKEDTLIVNIYRYHLCHYISELYKLQAELIKPYMEELKQLIMDTVHVDDNPEESVKNEVELDESNVETL